MGKPQIPGVPSLLPKDWAPTPRMIATSALLRNVSADTLREATVKFRAYCAARGLKKTRWAHTFLWWLQQRQPR